MNAPIIPAVNAQVVFYTVDKFYPFCRDLTSYTKFVFIPNLPEAKNAYLISAESNPV